MKVVTIVLLLAVVFLCGCATTIADRRNERLTAYSAMPPDAQTLVDQGQIKVGMPKDAVYIAWGKPDRIIQGESQEGRSETWVYERSTLYPYQYWNYGSGYGIGPWSHPYNRPLPYYDMGWYPVFYVSREVRFQNNQVTSWHDLPRPPY